MTTITDFRKKFPLCRFKKVKGKIVVEEKSHVDLEDVAITETYSIIKKFGYGWDESRAIELEQLLTYTLKQQSSKQLLEAKGVVSTSNIAAHLSNKVAKWLEN